MRIATLIIGLVLMLGVFFQSLAVSVGDNLSDDKGGGGAVGVVVALGFLIGSALVLAKPRAAMWTFAATGGLGILAGSTTTFGDLTIWGIVALILALMAWRGSVEKHRSAEQAQKTPAKLPTGEPTRPVA
jgi:hypothetical protein